MRSIGYSASARKALDRMQPAKRDDIRQAIDRYAADPTLRHANVKPLVGRKGGYRIRVGDWRVICELTTDRIIVWDVLPRGDAYSKKHRR
ncbi:MAG: type II toxin-antitoxin system RelE/ParE family toxin [Rhodospirillaceae bacterium]|nr:type II toxin-antitoxin system RelE/ParE family toxin [Rhodospirillaceae bacterium]